jgi:hypothetical protein
VTVYDDKGRPHPDVGTGSPSFWDRPTNHYPGCTCPPWRYNPRHTRPTNPDCTEHGHKEKTA